VRIRLVCSECSKLNQNMAVFHTGIWNDDGIYVGTCPSGHSLNLLTQTLRHEMLFDIALNAIADHYYREAVSSFTSSMERFFEFVIRVICRHKNVTPIEFDKCWKHVKQSERQLGGYIFAHLGQFGSCPVMLPPTMVELRNDVIHKGQLPSRSEAIEFGEGVYCVIQCGVSKLRADCYDALMSTLCDHVGERATLLGKRIGKDAARSTQVSPTALNIIDGATRPFPVILAEYGLSTN
jgi:hypothetical protein